MDTLIRFGTALLLKQVASGQAKLSGTKVMGILAILFGTLGYLLGQLDYEQAGGFVGGGITAILLRKGQASETDRVKDHLSEQDWKLNAALAELRQIARDKK